MKKSIFLLLIFISQTVSAQVDTTKIESGLSFFIDSKILNEKIEVWIRLPEDFRIKKDSCSLLVLLDGDEYFKFASDVVSLYEWDEKIPPTIIIGLPSTVEGRWSYYTPSNVKYSGTSKEDSLLYLNSGKFNLYADFVQNELIPKIEKSFKVKLFSKTIFGHSMGGLGVLSFLVLRPNIFNNYIAASPSVIWDNNFLIKVAANRTSFGTLFISNGTPDIKNYPESISELIKKLRKKSISSKIQFAKYKFDNHGTTGLRTLLDGLVYVNAKP